MWREQSLFEVLGFVINIYYFQFQKPLLLIHFKSVQSKTRSREETLKAARHEPRGLAASPPLLATM